MIFNKIISQTPSFQIGEKFEQYVESETKSEKLFAKLWIIIGELSVDL
jgi:hypothetical protein